MKQSLELANIIIRYFTTIDYETFKFLVQEKFPEFIDYSISKNKIPILHIAAHGNKQGIQMSAKQYIDWRLLRDLLIPINKRLFGCLPICLSSCEGINGQEMAKTSGELPFSCLVSHCGKPRITDTSVAFTSFYHLLSKGLTFSDAVGGMKVASHDENFKIVFAKHVQEDYRRKIDEDTFTRLAQEIRNKEKSKRAYRPIRKHKWKPVRKMHKRKRITKK